MNSVVYKSLNPLWLLDCSVNRRDPILFCGFGFTDSASTASRLLFRRHADMRVALQHRSAHVTHQCEHNAFGTPVSAIFVAAVCLKSRNRRDTPAFSRRFSHAVLMVVGRVGSVGNGEPHGTRWSV
jgi:hypothetical protein